MVRALQSSFILTSVLAIWLTRGHLQALSFGLTQYDVEELKEHCDNRCMSTASLYSSDMGMLRTHRHLILMCQLHPPEATFSCCLSCSYAS